MKKILKLVGVVFFSFEILVSIFRIFTEPQSFNSIMPIIFADLLFALCIFLLLQENKPKIFPDKKIDTPHNIAAQIYKPNLDTLTKNNITSNYSNQTNNKHNDLCNAASANSEGKNIATLQGFLEKEGNERISDFFEVSFRHIDPDENLTTPKSAKISYLDAQALKFWSRQTTDFKVPQYYSESAFGRNAAPALERLLELGYLEIGPIEKNIGLKKVPELKAILAGKGLKTSGNKKELIDRIMNNFENDELEKLFPVGVYEITPSGEDAIKIYSIVEKDKSYSLDFSYYRLMEERETHYNESDDEILTRLIKEDLIKFQKTGDRSSFQTLSTRAGFYFDAIGSTDLALKTYINSFFLWAMDVQELGIENYKGQSYYLAKHIEEYGKKQNISLKDLLSELEKTLRESNLFGMTSIKNIQYTMKLFTDALSVSHIC